MTSYLRPSAGRRPCVHRTLPRHTRANGGVSPGWYMLGVNTRGDSGAGAGMSHDAYHNAPGAQGVEDYANERTNCSPPN